MPAAGTRRRYMLRTSVVCRLGAALLVCAPIAATATTKTVTNLDNDGAGSLRETINNAVANDVIVFSVTGTITLTTGEIDITKSLTISGPGAKSLTIARSSDPNTPEFRIFLIGSGAHPGPTVSISGVT